MTLAIWQSSSRRSSPIDVKVGDTSLNHPFLVKPSSRTLNTQMLTEGEVIVGLLIYIPSTPWTDLRATQMLPVVLINRTSQK